MRNCLMMFLMSCVLAGSGRAQEPVPDWPPYFSPMVLQEVSGQKGGETVTTPKAFLLHREDFERIKIMGSDLDVCERDLSACEQREVDEVKLPEFWESTTGVLLTHGLAFAAGIGTVVAVVYAVGGG